MSGGYNGAGVYVFRVRRPGLFGHVPILGRHFGYVGMSRHVRSRRAQHLKGSVQYNTMPKPWTDLKPTWYYIALPLAPKWLLLTLETVLILCLWPVYNHQKNLWNPRRISLRAAQRQRGARDVVRWSFNFRPAHALLGAAVIGVGIAKGWWL